MEGITKRKRERERKRFKKRGANFKEKELEDLEE